MDRRVAIAAGVLVVAAVAGAAAFVINGRSPDAPSTPQFDDSELNAGTSLTLDDLYGIGMVYTMVPFPAVEDTVEAMGDTVRFIAVPNFRSDDRVTEFGDGYVKTVEKFHAIGSRIVKFWVAPRALDYGDEVGDRDMMRLDSPYKLAAMEAAHDLGMAFMVHIADPDTWFQTKYADASKYGTKAQQYELQAFGRVSIRR